METTEELQSQEITALQSIYPDEFATCPPPKAWGGATRLPEFTIRVTHPDHPEKVNFRLHTKFPKTYPKLAPAAFAVQQPMIGISPDAVNKLTAAIHAEAKALKGSEMVFQIVQFAQDWLVENIRPATENPFSLATEAARRAEEAKQAKASANALAAEQAAQRAAEQATLLQSQLQAEQAALAEQAQQRQRRPRANTDATEIPLDDPTAGHVPTEIFSEKITIQGVSFNTVKLFHPRKDGLATTYQAEPVCDNTHTSLPLEVSIINFDSVYYTHPPGRRKLRELRCELQALSNTRHRNLLSLHAFKIHIPPDGSTAPSRLVLLNERTPRTTLADVLSDAECVREEKGYEYICHLLCGLDALHRADILHRGILPSCVGLATESNYDDSSPITAMVDGSFHLANGSTGSRNSRGRGGPARTLKLARAAWPTLVLNLHRSNPITDAGGLGSELTQTYPRPVSPTSSYDEGFMSGEGQIPDGWQLPETRARPLVYTRSRDLHAAGVVALQMLLGLEVTRSFEHPGDAISIALNRHSPVVREAIRAMLFQPKKGTSSAAQILQDLQDPNGRRNASRSPALTIAPAPRYHTRRPGPELDGAHLPFAQSTSALTIPTIQATDPEDTANSPDTVSYFHAGAEARAGTTPLGASGLITTPVPRSAGIPTSGNSFQLPHRMAGTPVPPRPSRWMDDWEQLEALGSGAFGSVVKARNRNDGQIYAVKRVHLRGVEGSTEEQKLWREVRTLSKLSHRNIVRYYSTWTEENADIGSAAHSTDGSEESSERTSKGESIGTQSEFPIGFSMTRTTSVSSTSSLSRAGDPLRSTGQSFAGIIPRGLDSSNEGTEGDEDHDDDDDDEDEEEPVFDFAIEDDFIEFTLEDDLTVASGQASVAASPAPRPIALPMVARTSSTETSVPLSPLPPTRIMFIQMEFVERQTLKERIDEGLTEQESWRLFQQIVDALVYIGSLNILHRDIKLTNIFIDAKGDCKIGDFGLATTNAESESSEPVSAPTSQLLAIPSSLHQEHTSNVGTGLYIAPEVERPKGRKRQNDYSKADLYSAGIVFFEMNFTFATQSERIFVIQRLRKNELDFPGSWDSRRVRQRSIIEWLLKHDPSQRPTALELSRSDLMPARVEDEYFQEALRMMAHPDSQHFQSVLRALFSQPVRQVRSIMYDRQDDLPEHIRQSQQQAAGLFPVVRARLTEIFRLHGAVDMDPMLLMPVTGEENENNVMLLDKHGDPLILPGDGILPLARLAAKREVTRIKRYHIGEVYKANSTPGHPRAFKSAVYDIITHDLVTGPYAAAAEVIAVISECFNAFPTMDQKVEIRVSHSEIQEAVLGDIPASIRVQVLDILQQNKSSTSQKRQLLLKLGLSRSKADEVEVLNESDTDFDALYSRISKVSPSLLAKINQPLSEIRMTLDYVARLNVRLPLTVHTHISSITNQASHFSDGVCFDVVRRAKRIEVLASGGRYDKLVASLSTQGPTRVPVCAFGAQIAVDKITSALLAFQSTSVAKLIQEQHSFGYWSPRRCDVYISSFTVGYTRDRLEVAAWLWQNGISADVMYESGFSEVEQEDLMDMCRREGILFVVYPRARHGRGDQPAFKVKSVLKGAEFELSKQELIAWLQQEISEQKRIDAAQSGVARAPVIPLTGTSVKELPTSSGTQLLLPGDAKKRVKTKQLFLDRACDLAEQVKASLQTGMQVLAVDVPPPVFDSLVKDSAWLTDDDLWRSISNSFPVGQAGYAQQVRDAAFKRRVEGHKFLVLVAVKEERVSLLTL